MEALLARNLEQTYRRERTNLLGYIRSRVSNQEDAEDILQEVYTQAIRTIDAANPVDNLLGWLYKSASNRVIDWYRKKRRQTVSLHAKTGRDDKSGLPLEELLADSGIDAETAFIRNLVIEGLTESIDDLPPEQREVFIRQAVYGETFKEIAADTGISINTLLARKRYAVKFLQKRLEDMKYLIDGGIV
jgi:RNA polymerase sigma factor (sigma-70 family)